MADDMARKAQRASNKVAEPMGLHIKQHEWAYIAEGNAHVVLRYTGMDPRLLGRVLRLSKSSGRESVSKIDELGITAVANRCAISEGKRVENPREKTLPLCAPPQEATSLRRDFERRVLAPLLGAQYVQLGEPVKLTEKSVQELRQSIAGVRPRFRVKKDVQNWCTMADLVPDNTSFWLDIPQRKSLGQGSRRRCSGGDSEGDTGEVSGLQSTETASTLRQGGDLEQGYSDLSTGYGRQYSKGTSASLAVEIKPKGAVMPVSALVPPGPSRLKYRVLRFHALQLIKAQKGGEGGPEGELGSPNLVSAFDPREFYSGDSGSIASSICKLFEAPQNKLRVWAKGDLVFGSEMPTQWRQHDSDLGAGERENGSEKSSAAGLRRVGKGYEGTDSEAEVLEEAPEVFAGVDKSGIQPGQRPERLALKGGFAHAGVGTRRLAEAVVNAGLSDRTSPPVWSLASFLGKILSKEPLLERILKMQRLDILEVEGAWLVLQRLIFLCGGSRDVALDLLTKAQYQPLLSEVSCSEEDALTLPQDLLSVLQKNHGAHGVIRKNLPTARPEAEEGKGDGDMGERACKYSDIHEAGFGSLTHPIVGQSPLGDCGVDFFGEETDMITSEEQVENTRMVAEMRLLNKLFGQGVAAVHQLGCDQCISLLHRWLMALGACDCSIMVSVQILPQQEQLRGEVCSVPRGGTYDPAEGAGGELVTDELKMKEASYWRAQEEHIAGEVEIDARRFAYCISVVDAGPKPPWKVEAKKQAEYHIWRFLADCRVATLHAEYKRRYPA